MSDWLRREEIGPATLYLGDCRSVLPVLGRADHVITDPPYEPEAHTKGRRLLGAQKDGRRSVEFGALDFAAMDEEQRSLVAALLASNTAGWLLTFCQAEAVHAWRQAIAAGGGALHARDGLG